MTSQIIIVSEALRCYRTCKIPGNSILLAKKTIDVWI